MTTSSGFGYVTARSPSMSGNHSVTVQPKLWKNGSDARMDSPLVEFHHHAELREVSQEVAVAEDNAFWFA